MNSSIDAETESDSESLQFHWADYLIFALMLLISSGIGIYHACQARRTSVSVDTHLTGRRKMSLLPVTLSISASFMSAVFILGIPSEIYNNGGLYMLYSIGYVPVYIVSAMVFVPIIHKLNLSSGYQYLEKRFNSYIRVLASATFTFEMIIYMGVVMYAPALALSQVTSFSTEISILIMGVVCTFYTSIGGIKAVIWTDVFQILIITAGMLAIMIQGAMNLGGWSVVFNTAKEAGKMPYFEMDPDPFVRHTFWTLTFGGFFTSITVFAANQAVLQRYMSLPTTKQAKMSILLNLPLAEFYLIIVCMTGFVLYARYADDNPIQSGLIKQPDQIVPLFMMETFSFFPGLPGLFVACVFSAALSTVSSGVNSLAVVTVVDFIKPVLDRRTSGSDSTRILSVLSVVVAIGYGVITTAMAYLSGLLGSTVLQIALSIFGMVGGPLLGLFVNGMFCPCVNAWGAAAGLAVSLSVCLWLGVGGTIYRNSLHSKPVGASFINSTAVSIFNQTVSYVTQPSLYSVYNSTDNITSIQSDASYTKDIPQSGLSLFLSKWYSLSYLHYASLAVLLSLIVGVLVSACTGFNKKRHVNRETYYDLLCCFRTKQNIDLDHNTYMLSEGVTDSKPGKPELVHMNSANSHRSNTDSIS